MFRYQLYCVLLISTLLSFLACKKPQTVAFEPSVVISTSDYQSDWEEIQQMEKKGMGKSIIEKTDQILQRALTENNVNQVFKALAYRSKYSNSIEEESTLKILTAYEDQIKEANLPLKQLLHSAIGELYFQYYNQNRWRFNQRTKTESFDEKDVRSWNLEKIFSHIHQHYLASLKFERELKAFPLESFALIINESQRKSEDQPLNYSLRPSLYDFLIDRALTQIKHNERVTKPIDEFKVDNYPIFSLSKNFVTIDFQTTDSTSNDYLTAKLYQNWTASHIEDKNPHVLINIELNRLKHYYTTSNNDNKDSLYLNALQKLSSFPNLTKMKDEIDFQIAQLYFQWGSNFNPKDENDNKREFLKKAHKICKSKEGKNNFGAKQCLALLQNIEMPSFSFQTEDTYLPDQSVLFRFQYQNVDSIYFRIVKISYSDYQENVRERPESLVRNLLSKKTHRNWKENLPNINDFQPHSIELFTKTLEKGNYYLLASPKENFDVDEDEIAFTNIKVSQLSYLSRRSKDGDKVEVYIRNRRNGTAVPNSKIVAFHTQYNYSSRNSTYQKIGDFTTNEEGYSSFGGGDNHENLSFSIYSKEDTLISNSNYYTYRRNKNNRTFLQTHLFTDRAIYRPGQTIYFKGIVIESNSKNKLPKSNLKTEVTLYNINGEQLSSIELKTNDYGSYQGSFTLPSGGLNGNYRIQDKHGSCYFSVEEYKRPTFKVIIDSSTTQNRINKTVPLRGKVTAFSGASVSGAQLKYRVIRRASYPNWSYLRSFIPPTNQKEIANGTLITNEKGEFAFDFIAQADASIQAKWNPIFNYEVIVDATSSSGETQVVTSIIKLSQQALFLNSSIDGAIQLEELKQMTVTAKNISGNKISVDANLSLWKLKTPRSPQKPRLWAETESIALSEQEFNKVFPLYSYKNYNQIQDFERDFEVSNSRIKCNQKFNLFRDIKSGAYEIVATAVDQFGKEVVLKKRFILYKEDSKIPPYPVFSWVEEIKTKGEPGEDAEFLIASSLKNLKLLCEVEHQGRIVSKKWFTINESQQKVTIPIEKLYRGNFSVHFTGVHSGRMIQHTSNVIVPFTNKKLNLQLGTYRNKLEPASKEKWTLNISGHQDDVAAAELLASMYDRSLDQFVKKDWALNLYQNNYSQLKWDMNQSFNSRSSRIFRKKQIQYAVAPQHSYPSLNWFGFQLGYSRYKTYNKSMPMIAESMSADVDYEVGDIVEETSLANDEANTKEKEVEQKVSVSQNPIRSDFRETVFFYPQLRTDATGKVSFEFTMPDALTQWKFRALAYTKSLKVGLLEETIQTQKKLMIVPNTPRFFRVGDELEFTALINNLSDKTLSGYSSLQFFDAVTNYKIDVFPTNSDDQSFEIKTNGNASVSWKIKIPEGYEAITYKIVAKTDHYSDGEEKAIPVLPNRILVTESIPLWIKGNETKEFNFKKLLNSSNQKTLTHERLTFEFTPNPAWYAIQALPTLTDNGNECSEKVFARLYANSLAERIANNNPEIKAVFDRWKLSDSQELTSKLEQNQELKNILIEESPWLREAKNETEQKRRIAVLFDYNQMAQKKKEAINKLSQLQLPNGGWSWYKGMRDNRYITQYIVEGLGHLKHLGVDLQKDKKLNQMLQKAIQYLDARIEEDYQRLIAKKVDLSKNNLNPVKIHYLYTRSFFQGLPIQKENQAFKYFLKQSKKYWLKFGIYQQGMSALAINRFAKDSPIPQQITASLNDNALNNDEMGMYWKSNSGGYYWYQSAIETQALMIELFAEMGKQQEVEELKLWLLKQKQTQAWNNSKATVNACYALLMTGENLLTTHSSMDISVGTQKLAIDPSKTEAGTGYFKKVYAANEVKANMGSIKVEKKTKGFAWGAAYWQYYQDLDKITSINESSLKLDKTLFKVSISNKGESMKPVKISEIKIGDKLKVRLRLEVDRNLEFVHLKDMRAAAFEPTNVLSQYKYQDGLGYYESTKDASTNFFIDWLPKGVYVFEYDLRVSQVGEFSNGISTIQCLYAPEFLAHSKGRKIEIKK